MGELETIEAIPLGKTMQVPLYMMDVSNSMVMGNIQAVMQMLTQARVGDPNEKADHVHPVEDISDFVLLFHVDLGTWEQVQLAQTSCGIEETLCNHFQFMIFVLGLFHVKMATAEAFWYIFLQSPEDHKDDTSMMSLAVVIRRDETGKLGSHPTFRQMHEMIQEVGIANRFDAWGAIISVGNPSIDALEKWAKSKPIWDEIEELSKKLKLLECIYPNNLILCFLRPA